MILIVGKQKAQTYCVIIGDCESIGEISDRFGDMCVCVRIFSSLQQLGFKRDELRIHLSVIDMLIIIGCQRIGKRGEGRSQV